MTAEGIVGAPTCFSQFDFDTCYCQLTSIPDSHSGCEVTVVVDEDEPSSHRCSQQ
jgi:hypothetical protein